MKTSGIKVRGSIRSRNGDTAACPADLPAGIFSSWLRRTRDALISGRGTDVPCGECRGCCTSSYFVHVGPGERRTLSRIPDEYLFTAPMLPAGYMLMGYDERGHCQMMIDGACSIYQDRPLTCRTYDCRIFAATGVAAGDTGPALITRRVKRWKFEYPAERDRTQQAAVRAAVEFLQAHARLFPAGAVPDNATQCALYAIKVYAVFLPQDERPCASGDAATARDVVKAVLDAHEKFSAKCRGRAIAAQASNDNKII
jgi:uncharacterized protein